MSINLEVQGAFPIPDLRFGHLDDPLGQRTGLVVGFQHGGPILFGFQVRVYIAVAGLVVNMLFQVTAGLALLRVGVLGLAAEGITRHGDAGQLQTPEGDKNDQKRKHGENELPFLCIFAQAVYIGQIFLGAVFQLPSSFLC